MAQADRYMLSFPELTTILLQHLGVHEGHWMLYVELQSEPTNVMHNSDPATMRPALLTSMQRLGVQRSEVPTGLSVDAAVVNPLVVETPWDDELRGLPRGG